MSKEIKKKVTEEWLSSVPQLTAFAQNKLYRIVGCVIIGIELVKLPKVEDYRPHFVIYPLWKSDLKKCLDSPIVLMEISNKKGFQFSIPYLKHNSFFNEAIECLEKQIPFLSNENIQLKSLFDFVDNLFNDVLIKSNSAQQAKLFELKFYTALYSGNQSQAQNILNHIKQASRNWNMQMFEVWYGNFEIWFQGLQDKIVSSEEFLQFIKINKQDKKNSRLKCTEIIS